MRFFAYPLTLAIALVIALAPAALAEYEEGQDPCPPEMLCTTSAPEEQPVSDGTADGHDDAPMSYDGSGDPGREVYASGPAGDAVASDGSTGVPAVAILLVLGALAIVGALVRNK